MLRKIFAGSRYIIFLAVLGTFLASMTIIVYGCVTVINVIVETIMHGVFTTDGAKHLSIECIEIIDLFLFGAILYITALGLYELFINEDLPMPAWLAISNLEDLKGKLLAAIILLLAVSFLGYVSSWNGTTAILALGVAIGIVIFALAYLLSQGAH